MDIIKVKQVSTPLALRLSEYLKIKKPLPNYKFGGIIYCWKFNFGKGFHLDVILKNGADGPYITSRHSWTFIQTFPSKMTKKLHWYDSRWTIEGANSISHPITRDTCYAVLKIKSLTEEFIEEEP